MLAAIIIIYFGILAQVFFPQLTVLENFLALLNVLGENGIVGLLVAADILLIIIYIYT